MPPAALLINEEHEIATVTLNRPEQRNALDADLIQQLTAAYRTLAGRADLRGVVLQGEGAIFCGGADINYMRAALDLGEQHNYEDALRLSDLFAAIDDCPLATLVKVQGAALGGGAGLVAVNDIAIAADDALFGFTEAKLGIVPAVISPFVLRKIGQSHARALFMTAERFHAERALRVGLVHEVVPYPQLDATLDGKLRELRTSAPSAVRLAKQIARSVGAMPAGQAREWTARRIAEQRASAQGQEGLRAFLEKRRPTWQ
ncbi:MAG: enoyl-CoA hydratase-related protein [Candidatus Eremiobacteraeota bacterium]|nr:enoyl-CoA hydratase-related protein [Candidatus Eremiobacteraeota bacterium]